MHTFDNKLSDPIYDRICFKTTTYIKKYSHGFVMILMKGGLNGKSMETIFASND